MNFGQSLAGRLFKLVFGGYLILAILVTSVQLGLEYSSEQRLIGSDLVSLGQSFNGGVAGAMWELDRPLMKTMAQGIAQTSIVTGVRIASASGETLAAVGEIPSTEPVNIDGFFAPFQFNATSLRKETPTGTRELGQLTIYSDRSVALERVKYSFFVILINSLVKTAGLWLIFYLVISKGLSRPLAKLTEVVSHLEFAADSKEAIAVDYPHQDEMGRLVGSMRKMQERLFEARRELDRVNYGLEKAVAERTQYLSDALEFNETILLSSPLPMGVYAASGQCILANEAYAKVVGASRKDLLAQNFRQLDSWKTSGLLDYCLTALAHHSPQQREIYAISSFGKEVWLECRILPTYFNGEDHLLIQFFDLTERKRIEDELRHLAGHDSLTRLPNRRLLEDRLGQALRASKRKNSYAALLFLDLNRFKQLNDSHGHDVGDQLLIEVAARLQKIVRGSDTVARFGGDEFVVLLESLGSEAEQAEKYAISVADKIRADLGMEYVLGAIHYQGSASIGIKLFIGDEGSPEQILKDADMAMYEAKKAAAGSIG